MWEPQPLTTLRASTACIRITLPYLTPFTNSEHCTENCTSAFTCTTLHGNMQDICTRVPNHTDLQSPFDILGSRMNKSHKFTY
jgi:hypothetical protein